MIKFLKDYKYYLLSIIILLIIIVLPPIINKQHYLIINGDTQAHLNAFENMKNGDNDSLYFGQLAIGYIMITLEKITNIDIPTLFMWFNFAMLFLASIVTSFVISIISKNIIVGIISLFVISFGSSSVMHLFYCGTIFNIIEVLIILPVFVLILYYIIKNKNYKLLLLLIPIAVIMYFFHPSLGSGIKMLFTSTSIKEHISNTIITFFSFFGISNIIILIIGFSKFIKYGKLKEINFSFKIIISLLSLLFVFLFVLMFFDLTPFSARMLYNSCIVLNIISMLFCGLVFNNSKFRLIKSAIIILTILSIIPNISVWFSLINSNVALN